MDGLRGTSGGPRYPAAQASLAVVGAAGRGGRRRGRDRRAGHRGPVEPGSGALIGFSGRDDVGTGGQCKAALDQLGPGDRCHAYPDNLGHDSRCSSAAQ